MTREEARAILAKHNAFNVEPYGLIRVRDAELLLTTQMLRLTKTHGKIRDPHAPTQLVSAP